MMLVVLCWDLPLRPPDPLVGLQILSVLLQGSSVRIWEISLPVCLGRLAIQG